MTFNNQLIHVMDLYQIIVMKCHSFQPSPTLNYQFKWHSITCMTINGKLIFILSIQSNKPIFCSICTRIVYYFHPSHIIAGISSIWVWGNFWLTNWTILYIPMYIFVSITIQSQFKIAGYFHPVYPMLSRNYVE